MVRVAGLEAQLFGEVEEGSTDGLTPEQQLAAISVRAHELVAEQYRIWNEGLRPGLFEAGRGAGQAGRARAEGAGRARPALLAGHLSGADADRDRPGAPVSARAQQEHQRRRDVREARLHQRTVVRRGAGAHDAAAPDPRPARRGAARVRRARRSDLPPPPRDFPADARDRARTPSASRATSTSRSTRTRPRTCLLTHPGRAAPPRTRPRGAHRGHRRRAGRFGGATVPGARSLARARRLPRRRARSSSAT